ncbi:MAG: dipeptidase, partial [Candidatus Krumholzibacteria bacterium]|nr:dipeptidase [Candidatus Krumholzibacteria bacterium]
IDTHIDVPYRLRKKEVDISRRTESGDFDYVRARDGGLDAAFMSIFTPAEYEGQGRSKELADSLIDMVEGFAVRWPDRFGVATSAAEVIELKSLGRFALLLGMENGSPIEGDLANLRYFHGRGVRYITLAHAKDNHLCDSSYDDSETWGGLSSFGRRVVREMNNLGIMIDVSHVSDETFYQVMRLSEAPVIASHSSCRQFTPGWQRNMSDDMIKLLAKNGGVIHINFGSVFISDECRRRFYAGKDKADEFARENGLDAKDKAVKEFRDHYFKEYPVGFADVTEVADHIDHVVGLVGVEHVGFGSDFDGVGDSLPTGLKDVSYYPSLVKELLVRGYSDSDLEKICSGNLLRVWREVERIAGEMNSTKRD